ncbi:CAAX prenyl protease [Stygiomarasmius scandens]|uniref:intramembrane prenyl-peptidase Rce1 n=1 Tax=Marasmiellus scandens TaxID=2682957 RepID=A0ABR1J662_9AGAR
MSTALSINEAHLLSLALTGIYVGALYISKYGRLGRPKLYSNMPSCTVPGGRKKTEFEQGLDEIERLLEEEERHKQEMPPSIQDLQGTKRSLVFERFGRDDPCIVLTRLLCVSLASVISLLILLNVVYVRVYRCGYTPPFMAGRSQLTISGWDENSPRVALNRTQELMGLGSSSVDMLASFLSFLFPTLLLYISFRLFSFGEVIPKPKSDATVKSAYALSVMALRDFVVGPLTEEIVFRGCILAVYRLTTCAPSSSLDLSVYISTRTSMNHSQSTSNHIAFAPPSGLTRTQMIVYSSLFYTIAHVHHDIVDYMKRFISTGRLPHNHHIVKLLKFGALQTLLGLMYASILTFQSSIIPAVIAHIILNAVFHVIHSISFETFKIGEIIDAIRVRLGEKIESLEESSKVQMLG